MNYIEQNVPTDISFLRFSMQLTRSPENIVMHTAISLNDGAFI